MTGPSQATSSQALEDRNSPPRGIWKVVSVAAIGSFMAQLDATVVNVSLENLAGELHTSLSSIQWVTSGYLLALALTLAVKRVAGGSHRC